jgi:hypothetical protein
MFELEKLSITFDEIQYRNYAIKSPPKHKINFLPLTTTWVHSLTSCRQDSNATQLCPEMKHAGIFDKHALSSVFFKNVKQKWQTYETDD